MKTFATLALLGIATALELKEDGQSYTSTESTSSSDTLDSNINREDGFMGDASSIGDGSDPDENQ